MNESIQIKSEYPDLDKYEYDNGTIWYCKKGTGIRHNPYGPAIIAKDGYKVYYIEDKLHRLDGPTRIYPTGVEEYYINNIRKGNTKQEFYNVIKNLNLWPKDINEQDKVNILNIKDSLLNGLSTNTINILKLLL